MQRKFTINSLRSTSAAQQRSFLADVCIPCVATDDHVKELATKRGLWLNGWLLQGLHVAPAATSVLA